MRRRTSESVVLGSGLFVAVLFGAHPVQACTCPGGEPVAAAFVPAAAFTAADAVFEGRVLEVTSDSAGLRVTIEVVQHWKGVESERAVVRTSASAACGVPFGEATSWLVYARGDEDGWTTDLCAGTRRIEDAAEALAALGAGVVPVDITDDDDVEEPATRSQAHRAGCASCAVQSPDSLPRAGVIGLIALGLIGARRRWRVAKREDG